MHPFPKKRNMKQLVILILLLGLSQVSFSQNNKGFFLTGDIGIQPQSTLKATNSSINASPKENGRILLGIQPSYQINESVQASLFYIFEGHEKPIPATSVLGVRGHYLVKKVAKTPFIDFGIGKGLSGNTGNGNNGIYLNPNIGYQFSKKYKVGAGYSLQSAKDFNYSPIRNTSGTIKTDATTHSFKLFGNFTLFRSNK